MEFFPPNMPHRVVSGRVIEPLAQFLERYSLQKQAILLTEQHFPEIETTDLRFWLLSCAEISLLVRCQPDPEARASSAQYRLGFSFDPADIRACLQDLAAQLPPAHPQMPQLQALQQAVAPISAAAQSDFSLALLEVLLPEAAEPAQQALLCQPVQRALDQQLEQSLLLNHVVTKIRQTLDLSIILQTTVAEVRQLLQADRLLIYQFDLKPAESARVMADVAAVEGKNNANNLGATYHSGHITYESRADETLPSVLHFSETYCFTGKPSYRDRYLNGQTIAVDDVDSRYAPFPCLLNFLRQVQVRSKVVVPILVQHRLWGLLIAHQCRYQRHWQSQELTFLQHIAEHLSIAISQSQLYQQLQQQTHNLEACVIERTQDLRDALAAAQSASRAKSEFLATMSHELRTPLTCIIGMSATLLRWSFGDLSPRQRDYLNTIHESGSHLLNLINDILEVSKIESGRTVLEIHSLSLVSLARQTMDAFRVEAAKRDLDLNIDLKLAQDQDTFAADPRRVRQILANLLSNAIKFTPEGGKVTLRVRREQSAAVFQVEDTGIGIPESQQPLLFEKFQQLENARQRQYQGTGLGLALTKQLVDLHGGSISLHSKVGMGSVFTVRIPLQRLSGDTAKPKPPGEIPSEPVVGRIVLVEDNEETASLICDMLTAADYQVIWVIEGSRVLDQVELLQPAAVLVNVNLTGANGYDIIRSLRQYVGTFSVKVLALTEGIPDQGDMARDVGADDILAKPVDPEALLKRVNALMAVAVR